MELQSGDYRFAFSEKHSQAIFVAPGEDYFLSDSLGPLDVEWGKQIEATSKPVRDKDYWNSPSKCTPLPAEPVSQDK